MRHLSRKTKFAAVAMAVAVGAAPSIPAPASASTTQTIKGAPIVWFNQRPSNGPVDAAVNVVAKQFAKLYPGFKLIIETTANRPAYLQKIYTLAAANQLPQLFDEDATPFAQELARAGKTVNIGAWLNKEGLTSDYKPLALNYDRFGNGSLYAVPLEFAMEYFFYNKALFKEAGVTPPTTLAQLVSDCGPLKAKGIIPIALDGVDGWPLLRYMAFYPFRLTGNTFITSLAQGKASLASPTGNAGAKFVASLGKADCFESGFSSTGYSDALNLFLSGKAAIIGDGSWDLSSMASPTLPANIRHNISYFLLPTVAGATTTRNDYVVSSGIGMAANASTWTPLVQAWVKYLIQHYPAVYAAMGQIPAMKYNNIKIPSNVIEPLYKDVIAEANKLGTQTARPWDTELDPTTTTVIEQDLPLLATGNMSPTAFESAVDQSVKQNAPKYFPGAP